jgi:hypothetical protein
MWDQKDHKGQLESQEIKDKLDLQETILPAQWDQEEIKDQQDQLEMLVTQEIKDQRDLKDLKDQPL